jgi:hypothetical protein
MSCGCQNIAVVTSYSLFGLGSLDIEFCFQAVDELFKLIQLFVVKFPDSTEQEIHEINNFKKQTLQLYLQVRCYDALCLSVITLQE